MKSGKGRSHSNTSHHQDSLKGVETPPWSLLSPAACSFRHVICNVISPLCCSTSSTKEGSPPLAWMSEVKLTILSTDSGETSGPPKSDLPLQCRLEKALRDALEGPALLCRLQQGRREHGPIQAFKTTFSRQGTHSSPPLVWQCQCHGQGSLCRGDPGSLLH